MSSSFVEEMRERLRQELDRCGYSLAGAARAIGDESSQSLRDTLSGRKKCSAELLARLAMVGIDAGYVLSGVNNHADSVHSVEIGGGYSAIPIYDIEAAAGAGRLFDDELIETSIQFDTEQLQRDGLDPAHVVGVRVRGDSMGETLHDGDRVLVDRSSRTPDGVFLLRMDDGLRIKRVQRVAGGGWMLISDNTHYQPEMIKPEEMGQVEIIGECRVRIGKIA